MFPTPINPATLERHLKGAMTPDMYNQIPPNVLNEGMAHACDALNTPLSAERTRG